MSVLTMSNSQRDGGTTETKESKSPRKGHLCANCRVRNERFRTGIGSEWKLSLRHGFATCWGHTLPSGEAEANV